MGLPGLAGCGRLNAVNGLLPPLFGSRLPPLFGLAAGLPDPNTELIPFPDGLPNTFLGFSGIEFGPFDKVADEKPDGITFATC